MDRKFMKAFLNNYYSNYQTEAVKDSEEYKERRSYRYELEKKFELMLQELSDDLIKVFDDYLDACADEKEILLQEMYLMGAQDREKMLRGII